jgi:hypothetical protein
MATDSFPYRNNAARELRRANDGQCQLTRLRNHFMMACLDEVFDTVCVTRFDKTLMLTLTGDLCAWQFTYHSDGAVIADDPQGLAGLDVELENAVISAVAGAVDAMMTLWPLLRPLTPALVSLSLEEGEVLEGDDDNGNDNDEEMVK